MNSGAQRIPKFILILLLSSATAGAEPLAQSTQEVELTPPTTQVPDDSNQPKQPIQAQDTSNSAGSPVHQELPDAPAPAQPAQPSQNGVSQQQNPESVPSGAAGAKAPTVKGAPAARPVGAAIAPAKTRRRRSLLIKAGLIAGACVAVGSAFALSKGSPSKPPGAP
jgi:hypothetical protein